MSLFKQLTRKKYLTSVLNEESRLGKVLTTLDLTAVGVGTTLGVGIYVLPGTVARDVAGPGVIISFLVAAVTSILAGLCFAEFGARVPKAGSAYTYSYVAMGELTAFVIGWSLIVEYIIGTSSVAKALSTYLDSMFGYKMEGFFREHLGMPPTTFLSEYVDLLAFAISIIVTICLATGLKESMTLNNLLTLTNVAVVLFVIIVGSFKADLSNWSIPGGRVPPAEGTGGFLPFGVSGVLAGAATCFFGYVGFDSISATGEEVKNPQRAIPLAIVLSLFIVFLAYFGVSAVITLMWPYYLQDPDSPLPYAFEHVGLSWAKWIVSVGGIFGLMTSLIGGFFPLPRIIYAMANDGLLFKFLGKVHSKYQTPFIGTLFAGFLIAVAAAIFKLKQLVDLMSISVLLVYSIVSASVLILRYDFENTVERGPVTHEAVESTPLVAQSSSPTLKYKLNQVFNCNKLLYPNKTSSNVVRFQTAVITVCSIVVSVIIAHYQQALMAKSITAITIAAVSVALMIVAMVSIWKQPSATETIQFKVPWVPLIPALSIFTNILFMVLLDFHTWIRFLAAVALGLVIYFAYGLFHSVEKRKKHIIKYEESTSRSDYEDEAPQA